jgi:arabinose-5-phosphate isomerase
MPGHVTRPFVRANVEDLFMENNRLVKGSTFIEQCMRTARETLIEEARAISVAADRLDAGVARATDLILSHVGKVVVTGVGKSGHIAHKIAATFSSTGTPAVFLHAAEAAHGDLGVYTPGDPTILISKSGATAELVSLMPMLRELNSPTIGILGNLNSPIARKVDVVLDARVEREADHLNLAPTSSTTVALALGDALAATLMRIRGFNDSDFARFHPSGQLGRNLLLHVKDVMHVGTEVAWVSPEDPLRSVVLAMTEHPLGAAIAIDEKRRLVGLITDGDLRRALYQNRDLSSIRARDMMTSKPTTAHQSMTLGDAARLMEDRPSQLSVLPVMDESGLCLGLLRLHDIYQSSLV